MPAPPPRCSQRLNQGVGSCGCGAPDDTAMVRCAACSACKHLSCAGLQRKPSSSRAWSCTTCWRVLQQQRMEARHHRAGAIARRAKESERKRTADARAIEGTVQMLVRKVEARAAAQWPFHSDCLFSRATAFPQRLPFHSDCEIY
jgi:hypothetical protein